MDDTLHAAPDCRYSDAFRWLKTEAMEYHKHNNTGMAADKTEKKSESEDSSKETAKGSGGAQEEAEIKTAAAGAAGQM
jgi:hypothetical protein